MTASRPDPFRILFVCLGNICRSPLAEGVFRDLVRKSGAEDRFEIESAGTGHWHVGESPDPRSREVAERHGIRLEGSGRQVEPGDFERFDLILGMDEQNLRDLESLMHAREDGGERAELRLLRDFDPEAEGDRDVPDPYYGGPHGFDRVYEMVERSCRTLLEEVDARTT